MPTGLLYTDSKDAFSSTAGSSGGSYLVPRKLYSQLIKDVKKKLILRALAAKVIGPSGVPGSTLVIPMQDKDTMTVNRVAEGAEVPMDIEEYGSVSISPKKYGFRIGISREFIEDSNFGVMSLQTQTAAYELADNEEALIISELDSASGQTAGTQVSNSNATLPLTDVTDGMQGLEEEYFTPTDMIVGVEVANDLRNIDELQNKNYGNNAISKRMVGQLWGMNVMVSNNVTNDYAYIIDRDHAFILVEKRPITIEKYFEAARDMSFAVVTQRIAAQYLRPGAVARIVTT